VEKIQYNDPVKQQRYLRALKRTEKLKKFYKHLIVYILVNLAITLVKINVYVNDGESLEEVMTRLDMYFVWVIWGVFLLLQGIRTFSRNSILGTDWEERKIRKYMNEN